MKVRQIHIKESTPAPEEPHLAPISPNQREREQVGWQDFNLIKDNSLGSCCGYWQQNSKSTTSKGNTSCNCCIRTVGCTKVGNPCILYNENQVQSATP